MAERKTYTEEQKMEILMKAAATSIAAAAKEFGVSRITITKWKAEADKDAGKIEVKKKTRAANRKVKEAVTAPAKKAAGDVKDAAEKAKTIREVETGKARARKDRESAEKAAAKENKAAEKAAAKNERAARRPSVKRKTAKLTMIFQSAAGGSITPEQIALKLPKEAVDAYVKIEENKIYWVGANGEMGSATIWD